MPNESYEDAAEARENKIDEMEATGKRYYNVTLTRQASQSLVLRVYAETAALASDMALTEAIEEGDGADWEDCGGCIDTPDVCGCEEDENQDHEEN